MKFLFDFLPILIFFITFKVYGVYTATSAAIGVSFLQVLYAWIKNRHVPPVLWLSLGLITVLGGATLFFHNELFIKWKPTAINWLFALILLGSQWFSQKPAIQRLMDSNFKLPSHVWKNLNLSWSFFFITMGALNIYVAYHFDTNMWVNFKLFGMLGLTVAFAIVQAIYLSRHLKLNEKH